jgi:hypothetical protein
MAYPLVCLATDRTFNFSKLIFNSMKGNVMSPYKFFMYPRFVQAVLNEFPLQPHKRVYKTPCLKPKVFQNMNKASDGWNGEFKPLFPEMLAKITQVQGEGAAIPVVPQHTPTITVPPIHYTPQVAHTYERRQKQRPPPIITLHNSEPFGIGTSSGGYRLQSIPTREESEPMPYDSPLPTGNTVGSVEGSEQQIELMELCTRLVKQVNSLEKDLAQTKKQHAKDFNSLTAEIKSLKEEVQGLKKQRYAKIVISSPSSPHDGDSKDFSEDFGNSQKHGRRTDAETKGRRIDIEDDADFDFGTLDLNFNEPFGVSNEAGAVPVQNLSTDEFMVPTAGQNFTTVGQNFTTVEEEVERIRKEKGKAVMSSKET